MAGGSIMMVHALIHMLVVGMPVAADGGMEIPLDGMQQAGLRLMEAGTISIHLVGW